MKQYEAEGPAINWSAQNTANKANACLQPVIWIPGHQFMISFQNYFKEVFIDGKLNCISRYIRIIMFQCYVYFGEIFKIPFWSPDRRWIFKSKDSTAARSIPYQKQMGHYLDFLFVGFVHCCISSIQDSVSYAIQTQQKA